MDLEKENVQPASLTEAEPESIPPSEAKQEAPAKDAPKPESRARRALRRTIRWVLVILIIFGLGFALAMYSFYLPQVKRVQQVQGELNQTNARVDALTGQIDSLNKVQEEKEVLQTKLDEAETHVHLLSSRADVASAQVALANDDPDRAKVYLVNTPETIRNLGALLGAEYQSEITAMQDRLALALKGIETKPTEAQADLHILENRLVDLENLLFVGP